jgi:hypothetical protein
VVPAVISDPVIDVDVACGGVRSFCEVQRGEEDVVAVIPEGVTGGCGSSVPVSVVEVIGVGNMMEEDEEGGNRLVNCGPGEK